MINFTMENNNDPKQVEFNTAVAQQEQISKLRDAINMARFNPLEFNTITNPLSPIPNYQITLQSLNGIWTYFRPNATPEEVKKVEKIRSLAESFVYNQNLSPIVFGKKGEVKIMIIDKTFS